MRLIVAFAVMLMLFLPYVGLTATSFSDDNEISLQKIVSFDRGYRYNVGGWTYVYIEGDPYERGFQHGYLLANEIVDMMVRWSNIVHKMPFIGMFTDKPGTGLYNRTSQIWWNFCKNRAMRVFWPNFPPEYKEEIRGIADGVRARGVRLFYRNVTYEDILNMNEMYETMQEFTNPQKGIHPLKTLFESLRRVIPQLNEKYEMEFLKEMVTQPPVDLCSGFIATGNATTDGQIVISQETFFGAGSWWFPYYIAERWNVVLDVNPSNGHRFVMSTAPGYIWSDENFYQNDNGIVFVDTTYASQGPWFRSGLPLAVRTRMAIQYSNSIDDVIYYLRHNSNGVWPAVWLIGDTKTGEIARMDLGLYRYRVWRTHDGFYWAANNIMDEKVRAEQLRLAAIYQGRLFQLFHLLFATEGYQYYTREYHPCDRDIKFEELGKKYYGKIDIEIVKNIMSTSPIGDYSSDCKVTDSYLVKNNGLWVFWGNTEGKTWNSTDLHINNYRGIPPNVEPSGWTRIFGIKRDDVSSRVHRSMKLKENLLKPKITWSTVINKSKRNDVSPKIINGNRYLYALTDGKILAIDRDTGLVEWRRDAGGADDIDFYDGKIIIGYGNGSVVMDENGDEIINLIEDRRVSSVDIDKSNMVVGCYDGDVLIFDSAGNLLYKKDFGEYPAYVKSLDDGSIVVCDGNNCNLVSMNGDTLWSIYLDGVITSKPAIYNNKLFVPSWNGRVYAIEIKDGGIDWHIDTGWGVDSTPCARDGKLYITSMDGNAYAVSMENGSLIWVFSTNAAIESSPLVYGEYVFIGSDDGRVYAINSSTGVCDWYFSPRYTIGEKIDYLTTPVRSSPVVSEGKLFFGAAGEVFALDPMTEEISPKDEGCSYYSSYEISALFFITSALVIVMLLGIYLYRTRR